MNYIPKHKQHVEYDLYPWRLCQITVPLLSMTSVRRKTHIPVYIGVV